MAPIIKKASSSYSLDLLLKEISDMELPDGSVVQLFDDKNIINKMHLEAAYLNAATSFKNGTNSANDLGMEMLLFAAMTNQIGDAIRICGAKSNSGFIIFASDKTAFTKASKLLSNSNKFAPSMEHITAAAKKFGISPGKEIDVMIIQKIAVSRLAD